MNVGVRYEAIPFPGLDPDTPYALLRKIDNDLKDFAPRVSFNWLATKDAKTVVRGAFGTFYDVPALSIFYTAARVNGDPSSAIRSRARTRRRPCFPNVPTFSDASLIVKPNINAFAPGYKNTYRIQGNMQVQGEIARNVILTIGYNYAEALRCGRTSRSTRSI
jgi:hypothetical protein